MTADAPTIRSRDVSQGVRLLTINRPERKNAFDQRTYHGLAGALTSAANDDSVHVIVVTGEGDVFSGGQDLPEMAAMAKGELKGANGFPALLNALETFPKPLIAAVNGAATGIGATMLLHCDLVYLSSSARLRFPFAEMGVPPEAGASALLPDLVGSQIASELLFTARWISAEEAVQLGLARAEFASEELLPNALMMAGTIASRSPYAVQTAKRLMREARGDRSEAARKREEAGFAALFASQRNAG